MNRIQKMYQLQSANFRLSQLSLQSYRQSTNLSHKSPSQQSTLDANLNSRSCPIKTNILTKMLTKMYDQFHYIDQVTFKKTNMKNLCPKKKIREKGNNIKGITSDVRGKNYSKSCENIELGTEKQEYQSNTILKLNSVDDRETMKSFNNLQNYIQEIKRIKQFRLNQLTTKRQKYLQKKKIKRHSEEEELGDQKVKEGSLIEKEKKQRKIIKEIKNKLYQINIEQFRKYCKKQQKFDPKKQKVLQFSSNVEKYLERPTQSKWSEYQKPLEHKLRRQKIKNSYIYDKQFDTILSNQASEFGKLIRMRIRHETQFNWQRNKMI